MKQEQTPRITPATLSALANGDLHNAAVAATQGGIEAQERAGQQSMAALFKTLPKEMSREIGEKLGFEYGADEDEIFVQVRPPAGWAIRPTDHAMHSDLIDDKGRVRAGIFYKAAFYDRRASGHWRTRYGVERDYDKESDSYTLHVRDRATDTNLHSIRVERPEGEASSDFYRRADQFDKDAAAWMRERFPNAADPVAYWDQ